MTIHLIIPPSGYIAQRWKESSMPPLGILYVAAVLENAGHDVRVTAADALKLDTAQILADIACGRPEIAGITITTENRFETFDLARTLKKAYPELFLVIGGPHATMAGADMIRHIPEVDAAVVGEGEQTMLEIAAWKASGAAPQELARIRGIICRQEGQPFFTGMRPVVENLDSLPFPAKHLVPMEKYNFSWPVGGRLLPTTNIIGSRGCPFQCNFCATPITWGRSVRGASPARLAEEIRWNMERFGSRYIWFFDDTFNYSPQRTEAVCAEICRRKLDIRFTAEVRIDALTYDLLARMKEAGCHYISFGLEAGAERIRRDVIHKNIPTRRAFEVLDWAQKLEIMTTVFFIFSHPSETWEEAQETVRIMEQIRPRSDITVSILHIYPGTELETLAREKGILPSGFSWSKRDKRVPLLPAAQGDVPLFKDQLSWRQIGELLIRWSQQSQKISFWRKIPELLRSLRSPRDVFVYMAIAWAYLKVRFRKKSPIPPSATGRRSG